MFVIGQFRKMPIYDCPKNVVYTSRRISLHTKKRSCENYYVLQLPQHQVPYLEVVLCFTDIIAYLDLCVRKISEPRWHEPL